MMDLLSLLLSSHLSLSHSVIKKVDTIDSNILSAILILIHLNSCFPISNISFSIPRITSLRGIPLCAEKDLSHGRNGDGNNKYDMKDNNERQRNSDLFSSSDFSHLKKASSASLSNDNNGNNNDNNNISSNSIAALQLFMISLGSYLKLSS